MKRFWYVIFFLVALAVSSIAFLYTPEIPLNELKDKYANEHSRFINIDGVDVHYRIEGNGPYIGLIHGTASSLHTWNDWTEVLKDDFTVIRMDLPAFGLTGPQSGNDYSYDFYVRFLDKFFDKLKIDSLHLAGNSLGGGIAWQYSLKYPGKINKLILIDASGYRSKTSDSPIIFELAKNSLTASLLRNITPMSFIEKNLKEVYYTDDIIEDTLVKRYYELTLRPGNRQAFIDRVNTQMNVQSSEIKNIQAPTLIQWGRYDEWIPVENGFLFQQDIKNASLIIYEAGHVPMEEMPNPTVNDAIEFLVN